MSAIAAVALGAALLTAPPPPARPDLAPAPAPEVRIETPADPAELERLLQDIRRIHRPREAPAGTAAPAAAGAAPAAPPASPAAPARTPLPPARQLLETLSELAAQSAGQPAPGGAQPTPAPPATSQPDPAAAVAGPGASPFPRRRPVWRPSGPETVGNRARPEGADDPGRLEADAAGRDATPVREAPQLVRRPPATAVVPEGTAARPATNPVCRDPRIDGTMIAQIAHASWPCGIAQPVRVNAIAGIRLSTPATLDCTTASRFATWVTGVLAPAARQRLGSGVETLWLMGSYACRRRNNRPQGKLSEHGRGRAVDIGGFWLADGRKVTVAGNWGKGAEGQVLAEAHAKACGLFHTVLGPGSDRYHADHLHLDTSQRGGNPYCR